MANFLMNTNPDTGAIDLSVSNGDIQYVEDLEEIGQRIVFELGTFLGEWFLDYSEGFAWFQEVFIKPNDPRRIQDLLTNLLLSIEGVLEIIRTPIITYDTETRIADIQTGVRTTFGIIEETFNIPLGQN